MNTTQDDGGPDLSEAQEYLAMMREANRSETKERNLRDWFAGMALQGMMANPEFNAMPGQDVARSCYRIAEEMLAERKDQP